MNSDDKIYIAGHNGLVGSSIVRKLNHYGYSNLIMQSHKTLDLTNQSDVAEFFSENKPDHVILSAAKVGGIFANNTYPADFIYQNTMIESNVIHSSYVNKVNKLIFLGSSCIYPREVKQPMSEDALLTGLLEPSNEPYAIAKIAGIKLCESFNRQYDTDYRSLMPTNLYGINDSFNSDISHVIPALITRMHDAKINGKSEIKVWGTGNAMREFMYVDDLAEAVIFVLKLDKDNYQEKINPMLSHLNVGTGVDVKISELATLIKKVVDYRGKIIFDSTKPDGSPRKLIDASKLTNMGWKCKVSLEDGLLETYQWYLNNLECN
jgi:GDP-L-fucose synthase